MARPKKSGKRSGWNPEPYELTINVNLRLPVELVARIDAYSQIQSIRRMQVMARAQAVRDLVRLALDAIERKEADAQRTAIKECIERSGYHFSISVSPTFAEAVTKFCIAEATLRGRLLNHQKAYRDLLLLGVQTAERAERARVPRKPRKEEGAE